jgi:hypothetical protein
MKNKQDPPSQADSEPDSFDFSIDDYFDIDALELKESGKLIYISFPLLALKRAFEKNDMKGLREAVNLQLKDLGYRTAPKPYGSRVTRLPGKHIQPPSGTIDASKLFDDDELSDEAQRHLIAARVAVLLELDSVDEEPARRQLVPRGKARPKNV